MCESSVCDAAALAEAPIFTEWASMSLLPWDVDYYAGSGDEVLALGFLVVFGELGFVVELYVDVAFGGFHG